MKFKFPNIFNVRKNFQNFTSCLFLKYHDCIVRTESLLNRINMKIFQSLFNNEKTSFNNIDSGPVGRLVRTRDLPVGP
jgi:hypothetical protein